MKAIIFGSGGQDGQFLADFLKSKDYGVVCVDRERVDITNRQDVYEFLNWHRDVKEIYNLAANSHVNLSMVEESQTWAVNAGGVFNIVECMIGLRINSKFMQASSREIFGSSYVVNNENQKEILEGTCLKPNTPYGTSKASAHKYIQMVRRSGVYASNCILFNHESEIRPERFVTRKITSWVGKYVAWRRKNNLHDMVCGVDLSDELNIYLLGDKTIFFPKLILGSLDSKRDWGHAEDYVKAMWLSLQAKTPSDYIICTGQLHSIAEFVDIAFSRVEIYNWLSHICIVTNAARPVDNDNDIIASPERAEFILGWKYETTFKELIYRMVDNDVRKNIYSEVEYDQSTGKT